MPLPPPGPADAGALTAPAMEAPLHAHPGLALGGTPQVRPRPLTPRASRPAGPRGRDARRQEILDAVRADPGLSVADLVGRLAGSRTALVHHLRVLERAGRVAFLRDGRSRRCFPVEDGPAGRTRAEATALRHPRTRDLLAYVTAHPGVTQTDLSRAAALGSSSVVWHTARLARAGLLSSVRVAGRRRFYAAGTAPPPAEREPGCAATGGRGG